MSLWGFSTRRKKPASRAAAKRTRRGRNRLGAIVEEHLEYEVPAELERYFFERDSTNAYCAASTDYIFSKVSPRVPSSLKTDMNSSWNKFKSVLQKEIAELRARGGEAPPVCILPPRSSPRIARHGAESLQMERKLTKHERFHARAENILRSFDVDYIEREKNVLPKVSKQLIRDFGEPARQALQLANRAGWARLKVDEAEEVLARVEEIIEDCSYEGDAQTCGFARRVIDRQIKEVNFLERLRRKPKKEIDPDAFNKLVEMIESRYGSASDYYVNMIARITGRTQTRIPKRQPRLKPSERRAEVIESPAPAPVEVPRAPKPKPQPQPRWEEPVDDEIDEIEEAPVEPKKKKPVETEKWIDDDGQEWEVIVKPKRGKKKLSGASWWRKGLRS